MNTKVIVPIIAVIVVLGGIGAYVYTDMGSSPETPEEPTDPTDGTDGGEGDGDDGGDETDPIGVSESVTANILYNAQDVVLSYNYYEENVNGETNQPSEVVFHTGDSPAEGTVIYEVDDPQSSVEEQFSFREDFNVGDRENLPATSVTVTYEDGSTEVIAEQEIDGSGPFIGEQITVDQNVETGETVITAGQFDADYLALQDGNGNEIGRIEEEGGSITVPPEEAYRTQEGNELFNSITFELVAHIGSNETRLQLVDAGFPEPNYTSSVAANGRYITEFEFGNYEEITVSGNNIAVGTANPDAELSEQVDVPITEPTTVVSEETVIVEVETENGYTVTFFASPPPEAR
jgi:hypothetical protein